jgi:tRNA-Thr(GGU) m(6)t(6)A37 methyltransferase TsaA
MQSQKDSFSLTPIGLIRTVFDNKFGTPRQGALAPHSQATFQLAAAWSQRGTFSGLEGFSHVWLISLFHQNSSTRNPSKVHPPRLLGESVGVLASRSPHRPNPLGLTLAKLERVEGDQLWLSGVDLVDGTPILDIKPYLAEADRPSHFTNGWAGDLQKSEIRCVFSPEAERDLESLCQSGRVAGRADFVALVNEVLALDPRPLSYRHRVNERFAVVLGGLDVHARYLDDTFTVISIQPFVQNHATKTRLGPAQS